MSRSWKCIALCLLALFVPQRGSCWTHGSAALTPAAVTCTIDGTCTGVGGGTNLFTAATCNGASDDAPGISSFNDWAKNTWQASHSGLVELDLPHGSVCVFHGIGNCSSGATCIGDGIKQFRLVGLGYSGNGDGATLRALEANSDRGFFLAAFHGIEEDDQHSARLASVNIGDSCVDLLDATKASLYTAGRYVLISGLDMQHGGFPPNPYYYEYPKISSVDASHKCDGTSGASVTFTAAVTNKYLSSWPLFNPGSSSSEADQGGPATLYALNAAWDTDQTYIGITIDQPEFQTNSNGRNIAFINVKATGGSCIYPSQNLNWSITNGDLSACDIEVDKINGTVTLTSVTLKQLNFQSSSVNQFNLINSTVINSQQGTPKKFSCSGSTIADLQIGAHSFGRTSEVDLGNCTIALYSGLSSITDNGDGSGTGGTHNVGFNFTREMSGGIIKAANTVLITNAVDQGGGVLRLTVACQAFYPTCSDATTAFTTGLYYELSNLLMSSGTQLGIYSVAAKNSGAHTIDINLDVGGATYVASGNIGAPQMTWAIPGTNMLWKGQIANQPPPFQAQTITQDGNWVYVQTSLAGGFPTMPTYTGPAGGAIGATVSPAPKFTCSGITGDPTLVALCADPAHGPLGSYFQATYTANGTAAVPVFGNLSSVEMNVTAANSGGGSPAFTLNGFGGAPFVVNSAGSIASWGPAVNMNQPGDRKVTLSGVTCNGSAGSCSGDTGLAVPDSTTTFLSDDQAEVKYSTTCAGCSTTLTIQTDQGVVYPPVYP